jgi:hypothetical protein
MAMTITVPVLVPVPFSNSFKTIHTIITKDPSSVEDLLT